MDTAPRRVEKLMTLSLSEFQHSLGPLAGNPVGPLAGKPVGSVTSIEIALAPGSVTIQYDARPSVRFGGLLEMPRAVVSLTFAGTAADQEVAFLKRFDLAFQRGGG